MKRILSVLAVVTVLAMLSCMFALPASAAVNTDGFAKEVVRLVNIERAKPENGSLPPLNFGNKAFNDAAMKRAKETTEVFSHTRPNGGAFYTVFGEYSLSYNTAGENIAEGQTSPAQVVAAWMNSPGHKQNILGGVYTDGTPLNFNWIGVAVCEKDGRLYWVQLFARATYTDDGDNDPKGGTATPAPATAPGITGPTAMSLTAGYAATSTGAYTITGTAPVTVTKTSGDAKITWNNTTKKLDIAAGLAAGTYSVTLTATNGTAPNAAITFTLTVAAAPVAPGITGPMAMSLTAGYAATSTGAYTITGTAPVTVTKTSGDAKITWNNTTKKLDIAAGLAAGTYSVTLTATNGTAPNAAITFTLTVAAAHTHTFSAGWQANGSSHWHECACGAQNGLAAHTPGDWMVDVPATATQAGSRHKQCIVCGYTTVTETIPAAGTPTNYIPGTTWEANTINFFLYYVCFGWLWMKLF